MGKSGLNTIAVLCLVRPIYFEKVGDINTLVSGVCTWSYNFQQLALLIE